MSALILAVMLASLLVVVPPTQRASAQDGGTTASLVVWEGDGGIVDNPRTWSFFQGDAATDMGSATAAAVGFDDSAWGEVDIRWKTLPGPFIANHFRKDFTLDEIGVDLFAVEAIRVSVNYDDTMVMYLNGVEVYRSIRGNLDPDFAQYPVGTDIPYNVEIPRGGCENCLIDIPNFNNDNQCENPTTRELDDCMFNPYGNNNDVPEIPVSLLNENGVNTWAVTTWNRTGPLDANGMWTSPGSRDSAFDHVFELLIDADAPPIVINEVMAANDQAVPIDIDGDPQDEYPDWFELHNMSSEIVPLEGWTISDGGASWVFPDIDMPANGYLVVAASDRDRIDLPILQTNFKLAREGDTLRLTDPIGLLADEYLMMPRQVNDTSYGRPNDSGEPTYLDSFTPGEANGTEADQLPPALRFFKNRVYNQGETVFHQIDAFDPDGDALSYSMSPLPPGLSVNANGEITGTATTAGTTLSNITVTDSNGDTDSQPAVLWTVLEAPTGPAPIVLSEYNAVPEDGELASGNGGAGNGGDWFEFLVIEDELDLRGYTFEFYDNKGDDDNLRVQSTVTVNNDDVFANAPAGTLITISEGTAVAPAVDDLSFDGQSDWHINLALTTGATGPSFGVPGSELGEDPVFNSTRKAQMVLIKDASGAVVTPLSGETEAWDNANGGVSGSEAMALCIDPTVGMSLDPVTAFSDVGDSTFGEPNVCVIPNPIDPNTVVTFTQDLSGLRSSASLGAGSGDANCDGQVTIADAVLAAQFTVGNRTDIGPCSFAGPVAPGTMNVNAVDMNLDGEVSIFDAVTIARCNVGLNIQWCPE